jgi:hypothetical protein
MKATPEDDTRPASLQAERTILGALMVVPEAVKEALPLLLEEDFSLDSHRKIYDAMRHIVEQGAVYPDQIILSNELRRRKEYEAVGGAGYLAELGTGIPRQLSIEGYIRIVRDKSLMRQLMAVCDSGMMEAADQSLDAIDVLERLRVQLAEIALNSGIRRNRNILIGAEDFMRDTPAAVEWTVEGLIQRGGNGIVVGDPGSAKSFSTLDLAHHLVAGVGWMGHKIPKRLKVAYIAREDHAGLTQHRGASLRKGYAGTDVGWALNEIDLNEWLYYNTRAQSETFSLQNGQDVLEIIDAFKEKGIEIAFFDVFRRLWEGDENDNKEVAKVLAVLTRIQTECNCSVCLVHHLNKSDGGTIFQRIRGSTSIYGWREWAFGISVENPQDDPKDRVRKVVFETKAATPEPVYYSFESASDDEVRLVSCGPPAASYKKPAGKKKDDRNEVSQNGWWE